MNEETVLNLRRSGKGYNEICKLTGLTKNEVGYICRRNNLGGFAAGSFPLTEMQVAAVVDQAGFEYVSGYSATKKPITVKCRQCGRMFERQYHIFRDVVNGTWRNENECPFCKEDKRQESRERRSVIKQQEREHDARINAERKAIMQAELISRQTAERLAIHVCKNCGEEYCIMVTGYNSRKYCSEKCCKRWANRIKNDRRIRRMKKREHDNDITLEKLYRRDGGVCYLCGESCKWDDVTDGNAGDKYPSIDHVKPLAKGGTHTWNNVKLACRKCNTLKRDHSTIPPP